MPPTELREDSASRLQCRIIRGPRLRAGETLLAELPWKSQSMDKDWEVDSGQFTEQFEDELKGMESSIGQDCMRVDFEARTSRRRTTLAAGVRHVSGCGGRDGMGESRVSSGVASLVGHIRKGSKESGHLW